MFPHYYKTKWICKSSLFSKIPSVSVPSQIYISPHFLLFSCTKQTLRLRASVWSHHNVTERPFKETFLPSVNICGPSFLWWALNRWHYLALVSGFSAEGAVANYISNTNWLFSWISAIEEKHKKKVTAPGVTAVSMISPIPTAICNFLLDILI